MDNLDEIHKFLETCNLPKLNQEESENPNRQITSEIKAVLKNLSINKRLGPDSCTGEFYQIFKEKLRSILYKQFQKIQKEGRLPSSFYKVSTILIPKLDKDTAKKENYRPISLTNRDAKIFNKILAN